jgi:hypothetical protein
MSKFEIYQNLQKMTLTLTTKVQKFLEESLSFQIETGLELLMAGNMLDFEKQLRQFVNELYDKITATLLRHIGLSSDFRQRLQSLAQRLGLGRLKKREVEIQISTGSWVRFKSYYAYQDKGLEELATRHLSCLYWGCIKKATPCYYSLAGALSVVCPSFEVACQLIDLQGIKMCYTRSRRLSVALGKQGREQGEKSLLAADESLAGKRVVIQLDGGRSRMREYNGLINDKGNLCYDTPWREPKLFVIQVLDEKGNVERKDTLPFYWATMDNGEQCLQQLTKVLKAMQAHRAESVQFLADGALFIWKHIRRALMEADIKSKKITLTVDYYHAVEHLTALVALLPDHLQAKGLFDKWKDFLWNGFCYSLGQDFRKIIREAGLELTQEMETALAYFKKHHDRMQYHKFRRRKLLCGSGLVESAIRRIINLRFKSASSFWLRDNLEQLIFLRCGFLSGRWNFLINTVASRYHGVGTN